MSRLNLFEWILRTCYSWWFPSSRLLSGELGDLPRWSSLLRLQKMFETCHPGVEKGYFALVERSKTKSWWLFGAPAWIRGCWEQPYTMGENRCLFAFLFFLHYFLFNSCLACFVNFLCWVTTRMSWYVLSIEFMLVYNNINVSVNHAKNLFSLIALRTT